MAKRVRPCLEGKKYDESFNLVSKTKIFLNGEMKDVINGRGSIMPL